MRTLLTAGLVVLLGACGAASVPEPAAQADSHSVPPPSRIQAVYQQLTPAQRVRQLIMPSIDSLDPAKAREVVRRTRPGGLIIMAPGTARQWAKVTRAAQAQAAQLGLPPLLIAADQENGTLVRRMRMPVTLPGAMVLGAAVAGDPDRGRTAAAAAAELTGRWLRSAGVNLDFAPVADVNVRPANPVIGIRSPGAFPAVVGTAVVGQVDGFDAAQVLSTAKHFPGHGDTATDSHVGLARVTHSRARLARIDLPPFQAAIDAGIPAIMVAHVTVPAIDDRPATVSRPVVTGLLRERMGFDGLVVSDSLGMGAVATRAGLYRDVLASGVDVLLMPNDPNGAVRQVRRAVRNNDLPAGRVRAAVQHVLAAKQRLGLLDEAPSYPARPTRAHSWQVARDVAGAGLTVLGSCRILIGRGATVVGSGPVAAGVRQGLQDAGVPSGPVRVVVSAVSPGAADVWVATGSPYGALRAPARQRVLTYGEVGASGWAAGQAIAGRLDRLGGLPVRGPRPCPRVQ
ncbi:MAG TPA: glycoside hydrolase family 3 protein [Actinomycetota bacterium]|nr:glycoside hydrolase family 3 protein [Actinomycetota bacterium]